MHAMIQQDSTVRNPEFSRNAWGDSLFLVRFDLDNPNHHSIALAYKQFSHHSFPSGWYTSNQQQQ